MTLEKFMQEKGFSYRQAGEFFSIGHVLIFKYVKGERNPSLETAVKISKRSKGLIKVEELLNDIPRRKRNGNRNRR